MVSSEQTDNSDRVEELHAVDELGEEVDVVFVLQRPDELHDEGGRNGGKSLLFVHEMLFQFSLDGLVFGDAFQGVEALLGAVSDQKDVSELPFSQFLHDLEFLQFEVFADFSQNISVDLLVFYDFEHGCTVAHGLSEAAVELFDNVFQGSPSYLAVLLHSYLALVGVIEIVKAALTIKGRPL